MYLTNILGQMIFLVQLNQASDSMMNLEMKPLSLSLPLPLSPSSLHIVNVWYKFNPVLCNRQKKTISNFLSTYLSLFLSLFCFECESAEIDCFVWRLTPPGNKIHFFLSFSNLFFILCIAGYFNTGQHLDVQLPIDCTIYLCASHNLVLFWI